MKEHTSLLFHGVVSVSHSRPWPHSERRPLPTSLRFLLLALFTLFAGNGAFAQASKLTNISSRLLCLTGEAAVVSEFVIQGGAAKQILVRAIGPSLNVPGPLLDPTMELCDSAGTIIRTNNNWKDSQQSAIEATGLPPVNDLESAIVATLAPGLYFTVVRGVSNTNGLALSEVYDLGGATSSFTALGTRGYVGNSDDVLVSGVILSGSQNQDVLVRVLGPSLANSGLSAALADPALELRDSNGSLLAVNNNWQTSQGTAIQNSGLAPSSAFESAIIATLPPGNYTSITRGAQNSTGLGFVQYYALPYSGSPLNPAPPLPALPVITSPLVASGTVGQLFTYQFEATDATLLEVTILPTGLTFDSALQAIVGNPDTSGTFQTGLSATNAAGTTNETLTITVQQPPASGPTIISSTAATGRTGRFFTFQVMTTGGSAFTRLSASGVPLGLDADPVTGLISGTPTFDGSFPVTLTVTDGNITTTSTVQLTFTSDPRVPVIISPNRATLTPGQFFSYTIVAPTSDSTDPPAFSYLGTLPSGLSFDSKTGTISGVYSGQPARIGGPPEVKEFSGGILVGKIQLFATKFSNTSTIELRFLAGPSGVVNISTRVRVGMDENVLIAGFIITGNAPEVVIIRALGPTIQNLPTLPDPTLKLQDSADNRVFNDDWETTQKDLINQTEIPPGDERESAILIGLDPGNYTATVAGKDGFGGIALVEVYDLGTANLNISNKARVAQISTRGHVGLNDNVMIGGFIIAPDPGPSRTVVVRAIGPSLRESGIQEPLQDPFLELRDSNANKVIFNDDWAVPYEGNADQKGDIEKTGIPPTDPRESAIVATLAPGNYTATVRGKDNAQGVALVEIYGLP